MDPVKSTSEPTPAPTDPTPAPAPTDPTPTPAPTDPTPTPTPETKEDTVPKSELDELKTAFETFKEEQDSKVEGLQDSLDSTLEELAMKSGQAITDPAPADPTSTPTKPTATPATPATPAPVKPETEIEKGLEDALKEDKDFRTKTESFMEETKSKEVQRSLEVEVAKALKDYPEAKEDDILRAVEDGKEEDNPNQIDVLAKASSEARVKDKETIKSEYEEELRAKLQKEKEGDISVPQSQSTPTSPKSPDSSEAVPPALQEEHEWAAAIEKSKAEKGGE